MEDESNSALLARLISLSGAPPLHRYCARRRIVPSLRQLRRAAPTPRNNAGFHTLHYSYVIAIGTWKSSCENGRFRTMWRIAKPLVRRTLRNGQPHPPLPSVVARRWSYHQQVVAAPPANVMQPKFAPAAVVIGGDAAPSVLSEETRRLDPQHSPRRRVTGQQGHESQASGDSAQRHRVEGRDTDEHRTDDARRDVDPRHTHE